ncbi:MAG: D-alanine--D-alanine ligase [Polyangia bacterium]|jgi:D-alanine-D-alanine ligase|nr:D-alanine--D-alanine ligase [Polyangia bacterium]
MKILILHQAVPEGAPPDERDVLAQAEAVAEGLRSLGHEALPWPCTMDLARLRSELEAEAPDCAWNIVESLGGHGRLIAHVPALLDALGIPYTGAPAEAMFLTSNKILGKAWLQACGLPVPPTVATWPVRLPEVPSEAALPPSTMYVVKSVWEHASIGLDEETLVKGASPGPEALAARAAALGGACFAEPFVEGREFNLSLLAGGADSPEVLPPAEIDFGAFPEGKPHLVGYRAKWDDGSFEYHHTPRRFDFPAGDERLLSLLGKLARRAWRHLGLRGYARVDFRVDSAERPWILEVNANPCISPDAGFVAAAERCGLTFAQVVERILADTPLRR